MHPFHERPNIRNQKVFFSHELELVLEFRHLRGFRVLADGSRVETSGGVNIPLRRIALIIYARI